MFKWIGSALILVGAIGSTSAMSLEKGATCHGCSSFQKRNVAVSAAGSAANFGVSVFVVDYDGEQLSKYFLLSGNPLRPELAMFYESLPPEVAVLSEEEVKTRASTVTAAEIQLTANEAKVFGDVMIYINYHEEHGIPTRTATRDGNPTVNDAFDVPSGMGVDSAFDVIGNPALTRQIGMLAQQADSRLGLFGRLGSSVNDVIPAIKTFVNLDTQYEFFFSDGSSALWGFDDRNNLDAIPGTFRDSNNNDIPENASDVNSGFFFGGPGLPENNETMNRMRARVSNLGIQFFGSGSGGGSPGGGGGTSCTWSCNEQSCTVTCRQQ